MPQPPIDPVIDETLSSGNSDMSSVFSDIEDAGEPETLTEAPQVLETAQEDDDDFDDFDEYDMPEGLPHYSPFTETTFKPGDRPMMLPTDDLSLDEINDVLVALNEEKKMTKEQLTAVATTLYELYSGTFKGRYSEGVNDRLLAQALLHESKRIANGRAGVKLKSGTTRLGGAAASHRIREKLGTGNEVYWRLWNSGLTIRLGNFTPGDLFVFQMQLAELHYEVGMNTRGQVLTTDDAHIIIKIVDWILDTHVTECNLRGWTASKIKDQLIIEDVYTLMTAALQAIYPKGYPFIRDCDFRPKELGGCTWSTLQGVNDPKNLVRLDFRKVTYVDTEKFTPFQKKIISSPWSSVTETDLERYREEFGTTVHTTKILNEEGEANYRLNVRAPVYSRYKEETLAWLNYVTRMVDQALEEAPDVSEQANVQRRAMAFSNYIQRANAQMHASWVKDIVEVSPEGEVVIGGESDQERIDVSTALADLATDAHVSQTIVNEIERIKLQEAKTFVGIPNYQCPSCGKGQQNYFEKRPSIIPISVPHYFFAIMVSTISQS